MSTKEFPPCGVYKTVSAIGSVEPGRLVYFHNHGDPGPGVYFPESWHQNRAQFAQNGTTVSPDFDGKALEALPTEGFYRVIKEFFCCEKHCTKFEPDVFVQLGYNGTGTPILFMPELTANGIKIPERGTVVDEKNFKNIVLLRIAQRDAATPEGGSSGGGDKNKPEIRFPRGGFTLH